MKILDIKIDEVTKKQAEEKVRSFLFDDKKHIICTPNTEIIMLAQHNPALKKCLNDSGLNIADGTGVLWAARFLTLPSPTLPILRELTILFEWLFSIILIPFAPSFFKNPIPEKINGSDFTNSVAKTAQKAGKNIYLLGGKPGIAKKAGETLQAKYLSLKIAGVDSSRAEETNKIIDSVNKTNADILLVGFGAPKQEIFLLENLEKTCCKVGMVVGGTFDFLAGDKKRAPRFIQSVGLEWLYRLVNEPNRIARQLSIPSFMAVILFHKLFKK